LLNLPPPLLSHEGFLVGNSILEPSLGPAAISLSINKSTQWDPETLVVCNIKAALKLNAKSNSAMEEEEEDLHWLV
jgi:hypothetical protein